MPLNTDSVKPKKAEFTGIWIPAHLYSFKELSDQDRTMIGFINGFKNAEFVSISYAAKCLNISRETAQRRVSKLSEDGFIHQISRGKGRPNHLVLTNKSQQTSIPVIEPSHPTCDETITPPVMEPSHDNKQIKNEIINTYSEAQSDDVRNAHLITDFIDYWRQAANSGSWPVIIMSGHDNHSIEFFGSQIQTRLSSELEHSTPDQLINELRTATTELIDNQEWRTTDDAQPKSISWHFEILDQFRKQGVFNGRTNTGSSYCTSQAPEANQSQTKAVDHSSEKEAGQTKHVASPSARHTGLISAQGELVARQRMRNWQKNTQISGEIRERLEQILFSNSVKAKSMGNKKNADITQ